MVEWAKETEDWDIWQTVPEEIKSELKAYYDGVYAGTIKDRTENDDTPCLWFDMNTRGCKHHQYRPSICREFPIGGAHCNKYRLSVGLRRIAKTPNTDAKP